MAMNSDKWRAIDNFVESNWLHPSLKYLAAERSPLFFEMVPPLTKQITCIRENTGKENITVGSVKKAETWPMYCSRPSGTVLLFPGQGVQNHIKNDLEELLNNKAACEVFKKASKLLERDVVRELFSNTEALSRTVDAQVAIFVHSIAKFRMLESERDILKDCIAVAGLSLGEYAALVAAKALDFEEGLKLVRDRAALMEAVVKSTKPSKHLCLETQPSIDLNGRLEDFNKRNKTRIEVACELRTHLFTVGGLVDDMEKLSRYASTDKSWIKSCTPVSTAAAFHTQAFSSGVAEMRNLLVNTTFNTPLVPVFSNTTGLFHKTSEDLPDLLSRHLVKPVRMSSFYAVLPIDAEAIECGAGKVLTNFWNKTRELSALP